MSTPPKKVEKGAKRLVKVQFKLDANVYKIIREAVPNVSEFLRGLIYGELENMEKLSERNRLEIELTRLKREMDKLDVWSRAMRYHGSYANASIKTVRGGIIEDKFPHYRRKVRPELGERERILSERAVRDRERLNERFQACFERYLKLVEAEMDAEERGKGPS